MTISLLPTCILAYSTAYLIVFTLYSNPSALNPAIRSDRGIRLPYTSSRLELLTIPVTTK